MPSSTMQREASSSSISSEDGDRSDVPTTRIAKASSPGKHDNAKTPKDWLSPPASPNPGLNPFFDEGEMKKAQMADSKFYASHHPDTHTQTAHTNGIMPDMSSLMSSSTGSPSNSQNASLPGPSTAVPSSSNVQPINQKKAEAYVQFEQPQQHQSRSRKRTPSVVQRSKAPSGASPSPSRVSMPSGVPNFQYKEDARPSLSRQNVNVEDDEQIELGLDDGEGAISVELQELYASFQTCIELRDKYMRYSCQRLEDNPMNYDGDFAPSRDSTSTSVSHPPSPERATPAPTPATNGTAIPEDATDYITSSSSTFQPWKIYPPPPKPHWEARDPFTQAEPVYTQDSYNQGEFKMEDCEIPGEHLFTFQLDSQGVYQVYRDEKSKAAQEETVYKVPTLKEYFQDLEYILGVISDGPAKSFAYRRIKYLESRWNLYCLLNEYQELAEMKRVPHRDFYNVRKVDTHVHHSACMNQKHLLRFIKSKMKKSADDVVTFRDGRYLTLRQVFESLNLTAYDLSIDTLDMHAHRDAFHRFDRFNAKYNPIGESRLREIFLKTDNHIKGTYLAEVTQEVFEDLKATKYQMAEYRISIYGRTRGEWDKLAKWVVNNKLFCDNVRWLIQIPRLYEVFKASKTVESFGDVVQNIFEPLFEVTKDPRSHPELHVFLQRVIGFDSVDDESKAERRLYRKYPFPKDWTTTQNPPYNYWLFYLYVNMANLNNWRKERGFNTFVLRPHAGEAGDTDHLTSAFLTSHSISHGILLRKVPALCYLFYLEQIGVAMSPLSNNALFLTYERNPFPQYFKLGLNVSLSTDDPLQLHYTKEPLMEEYSVAAQIYKFSPADMCELARNSVIQSGFEMEIKRHWLGHDWYLPGAEGNVVEKTNVPNVRVAFRYNTLVEERTMIRRYSNKYKGCKTPPLQTLQTRPDLFPSSKPQDALQGKDQNVASLAMGSTTMPDLASLKVAS